MDNNKEILNKIAFLKEAINNDKLVIFAGSGVSVDSGLPLWKDLLAGIKLKLNFNAEYENDALKISQLLFNEKGEKDYNSIIKEIIYRKSTNKYNPIHSIIYNLNPQHIVTTNYDNFFEQIIENEGLPFSLVVKDEDLPYAKHKNLLIKYHGDFDNHNIVLKETDYLEFSKNHTLKEIFVKSLFSNKVILFIGYSFSDINLKLLNREMQYLLKKHHQRAYIINLSDNVSHSEKIYYENLGINIINYNQAKNEILDLDKYLDISKNSLSQHSSKVYKILNYLKKFDLDKYKYNAGEKLKDDQIIDEVYNAMYRFYYFRVLPEKFIANFYPFNKYYKGNNNDLIVKEASITCYNEDLFNLVNKYQGEGDKNFNESQKEKIKYCLNRLIWAGVEYLVKPLNKPTHNIFKGDFSTKISLRKKTKDEKCDCINCNLRSYKFAKSLNQIDKYVISESSDLFDDLSYAFGLLSIFKNYKSFYALKQVFVKANKLKKYEVSFLAKYNMHRIGNTQITFLLPNLTNEEMKSIKNEVKSIDLDRELNKIRYFVDEKMFEFLREIKNGVYIQNLCNDIDDNYFKIFKTKNLIKGGGSSSNNDITNLYHGIVDLENFREYNFVYGNGFSKINKTIEKSISAFLTAYSIKLIDVSDSPRMFGVPALNTYNNYLLKMIVNYVKSKDLLDFLKENNLNNIEINESANNFIFDVSNFLSSATEDTPYEFMPELKFISEIISDDYFAQSLKTKLENICIIIAHFDFSVYQINTFIEKLNEFIKHVRFVQEFEYKYLEMVIDKKYNLIESSHLEKTMHLFHINYRYNQTYFLLLNVLKMKNENFVLKSFNLENLTFENNTQHIDSIYNSLDGNNKAIFISKLHEFLNSSEAKTVDFCFAIDNINFVTDEIIQTYKMKINSLLQLKSDYNYRKNQNIQILNFIRLLYFGKIDKLKIEKSKIKNEYYKFLLNPERYSKEKFDPLWLKICTDKIFLSRFKKNQYVIIALEKYLIANEDTELSNIYFKLRR